MATLQIIKLHYSLTSCRKINSKWIKCKTWTINLEENKGCKLFDIGLSNILPYLLRKGKQKQKNKQIGTWNEKSLHNVENDQPKKRPSPDGRRYLQMINSIRVSIQNKQRTHPTQHGKRQSDFKMGRGYE